MVQAILQNSIGIPDEGLWKNAVGLLKTQTLPDGLTVQAIQPLGTVETTKSVVVSRAG